MKWKSQIKGVDVPELRNNRVVHTTNLNKKIMRDAIDMTSESIMNAQILGGGGGPFSTIPSDNEDEQIK